MIMYLINYQIDSKKKGGYELVNRSKTNERRLKLYQDIDLLVLLSGKMVLLHRVREYHFTNAVIFTRRNFYSRQKIQEDVDRRKIRENFSLFVRGRTRSLSLFGRATREAKLFATFFVYRGSPKAHHFLVRQKMSRKVLASLVA
jgi:hypothetical protein